MQKDNQKVLNWNCGLLEEGEILPFMNTVMLVILWIPLLVAVLWDLDLPVIRNA